MAELVVLNGARAGAVFDLPDMPTVVGRSPEAHFQLDDPWISSMHAMFERRGTEIWVVDLESRNGTFVGTERVQEAQVLPGTVLRFGRTEVRIERQKTQRGVPFRHPTPPAIPISRPTSRLNAPETTDPQGSPITENLEPVESLPLALRAVALLRMTLHVPASASPPGADLIRAASDALHRAALNEGGLVVRLGSSGALAVFGAAGPSPDDVDFALRAAQAARADVANLNGEFTVRAAVDAGPAFLGNVSGPSGFELAVLGDAAERIERILALAGPGEIVAGPGAAGASGLGPVAKVKIGGEEIKVARVK